MLYYLLYGFLAIVGLIVLLIAGLIINLFLGTYRHERKIRKVISPVIDALKAGKSPDPAIVLEFASNAEYRNHLFDYMEDAGKPELFPTQFRTLEAYAESVFVHWLTHPNELQQAPDFIELIDKQLLDSKTDLGNLTYFVYRFKTNPPNFAADRGWMLGVCGPFLESPTPVLSSPLGLFSELNPIAKVSAEEFARKLHETGTQAKVDKIRQAMQKQHL
jgi:hypothetical protein